MLVSIPRAFAERLDQPHFTAKWNRPRPAGQQPDFTEAPAVAASGAG